MAPTTAQQSNQVALNSVVLNVDAIVAEKVGINCSCFTVGKLINPRAGHGFWTWDQLGDRTNQFGFWVI